LGAFFCGGPQKNRAIRSNKKPRGFYSAPIPCAAEKRKALFSLAARGFSAGNRIWTVGKTPADCRQFIKNVDIP
jgi:hypothetical protein